ncbi:MAG TPA: hypothetical protein VMD55_11265 [Terracidiphilus sp.]|nr:hypothetical protein [Terracidiphilus sp.]
MTTSLRFSAAHLRFVVCFLAILIAAAAPLGASAQQNSPQQVSPQLFNGLRWRLVGPFRAGRAVAVSGVPGSETTFFFGAVDGGVWKTSDAGTVWQPLFDAEPVASIGALAVAPSDPRVIYTGTGESDIRSDLATGDGVYRSDDAGETWTHVGLDDSRQISRILVDPTDARTVYVGVLGHAYGPNDTRGVYKSKDAGAHWQRVLDKGPDVGIADLAMAQNAPQILFAATWNAHRPPWSTYPPIEGPGNALYHSTDAGAHWAEISGHGLPEGAWGRTGIAVGADGRRVYLTIDCPGHSGLYRSDDGGETWALMSADPRLTSRAWYFNSLAIDPTDPDVLYIPNVALYRTIDGGKTIEIVRGAPGGDDYHQVWVDPKNPSHLALAVDQGVSISLDRGRTWSTWYNQPTAQLYHVTTDHSFPYAIYGAEQDSGAIAVYSRSDHGHIDMRDWFIPGGSESGYIAIDPKDENIIYLTEAYGGVSRFDRRTSFTQNVSPWPLMSFMTPIDKRRYRDTWTPVLVFSPADKTSLYLGTQFVMKTVDGGLHWTAISPDLTGAAGEAKDDKSPPTVGNAEQRGYGVVYTIAPSPLNADEIWAGSDTGLIHLTRDGGKTWLNVTPPGLTSWSKISLIEASHFDPATAYAAVDRHRLDDLKPYLYITHDYGKTWRLAVDGIAPTHFLRAVRKDTVNRDLLFAGTEFGVYVSFNDGLHWQHLNLSLPVSSIRDLNIHGSDLIVATHGRSFWVLDDIAPLRQAASAEGSHAYLYAPPPAIRVDNDTFLGTPLPPEEPQAGNPPNGAIVDYYLPADATKISLQILDAQGRVLRHFASDDKNASKRPLLPIAERWFPKPQTLSTAPGEHRFIWDLAAGGASARIEDGDNASAAPPGPRVPPGDYTLRLIVDGVQLDRPLRAVMDPRVTATPQELARQYALADSVYGQTLLSRKAMAELASVESRLTTLVGNAPPPELAAILAGALARLKRIESGEEEDSDEGSDGKQENEAGLAQANAGLAAVLGVCESGHRQPPAQALELLSQVSKAARESIAAWQHFKSADLAQVNAALARAHLQPIRIAAIEEQVHYAMTR